MEPISVRKHAVLVPGFAGFDALGQLNYYVGVTELFRLTQRDAGGTLHYFDNFPTSSVKVRADRLLQFLAKKIDRGEIQEADEVTLIGHSTGGLDIRAMLDTLLSDEGGKTKVDGHTIDNQIILQTIKRLVFLSVPHYGTNIADYLASLGSLVPSLLLDLGDGLRLNQGPLAAVRELLASPLNQSKSGLLLAILDALNESDLRVDEKASEVIREGDLASERDARAALIAWLDHIGHDMGAVNDLRSWTNVPPAPAHSAGKKTWTSPAHKGPKERQAELERWGDRFTTRSYATRVPTAPDGARSAAMLALASTARHTSGPLGELLHRSMGRALLLWALPNAAMLGFLLRVGAESIPLLIALGAVNQDPTLPFDLAYSLCANPKGPFRRPSDETFAPSFRRLGESEDSGSEPVSSLSEQDNDGIVNTLSMFWPYDKSKPTRHRLTLVEGDHGDVIGHHSLSRVDGRPLNGDRSRSSACNTADRSWPRQRVYQRYDLLASKAVFQQAEFVKLWTEILAFSLPR